MHDEQGAIRVGPKDHQDNDGERGVRCRVFKPHTTRVKPATREACWYCGVDTHDSTHEEEIRSGIEQVILLLSAWEAMRGEKSPQIQQPSSVQENSCGDTDNGTLQQTPLFSGPNLTGLEGQKDDCHE